jgi:hypothetical protein
MNPFANPEDSVPYEYVEFPKQEAAGFQLASFDQELTAEGSASSNGFVDFLNIKDQPEEKPVVQLAVFQNFKDVVSS